MLIFPPNKITENNEQRKNGNIGTLYSNAWSANIGTATITSNTTMENAKVTITP
jgi:hypothetical protein